MTCILVTGGAGFIGSNFIPFILKKWPQSSVINLDKLTYAASLDNLKEIELDSRYQLVKGDICDAQLVSQLFLKHKFNAVFHFAAESHVDNSISGPEVFFRTNVMGTYNLINCARNLWMKDPFVKNEGYENARFCMFRQTKSMGV